MEYRKVNSIAESCKSYPYLDRTSHPKGLTKEQYKLVLKTFLRCFVNMLITRGVVIDLMGMLGSFQVMSWKRKKKRKLVDFKLTNQIRKETGDNSIIKYSSGMLATNGYRPVLRWFTSRRAAGKTTLDYLSTNGLNKGATFRTRHNYQADFTRTVKRKNYQHKEHADINLMEFFLEKGFFIYEKLN